METDVSWTTKEQHSAVRLKPDLLDGSKASRHFHAGLFSFALRASTGEGAGATRFSASTTETVLSTVCTTIHYNPHSEARA